MRFRINGRLYEAALEPRVTLLAALRDAFGLTAAKEGCDRGVERGRGGCGACTLLLDGKPVYACSVLAIEAQDRPIETAGGRRDRLSPLEESLAAHAGFRCGFCAPGFAMAAKALLAASPHPSRGEIAEALAGNLCLCGAYPGVVRAVEQAAARKNGGDGHAGDG
jgi:aerobic-type carbon monoxide dehydrogenase small subunit (CoxS/CutS family)